MLRVNQIIENPDLKKYMQDAKAEKTSETIGRVYEEIAMRARLLIVVNIEAEIQTNDEGEQFVDDQAKIQFPLLSAPNGQLFYPAFTDMEEVHKWGIFGEENPTTVLMNFEDYLLMMDNNKNAEGFVVNPFSDNVILNRETVNHLRNKKEDVVNGIRQQRFKPGEKVMIGDPQEFPVMLAEDIREYLRTMEQVKKAWLRVMIQNEVPGYLIVIDADLDSEQELNEIFRGIAGAARDRLDDMTKLNMVSVTDRFGESAAKDSTPFYDREDDFVLKAQQKQEEKKQQENEETEETLEPEKTEKKKFHIFRKKN